MKLYYLIPILFFFSPKVNSQGLYPYFPSRLVFQALSPKIIIDNNVSKVKIMDHWYSRIDFDYEVFFNKNGAMKSVRYALNKDAFKSFTKRRKVDPIDTIYYNRTNVYSISKDIRSLSIKYSHNGKISEVLYHYNSAIIGCPIISISFNYNSNGKIKDEILKTCSENIKSTYHYDNDLIKSIDCIIIKTDILSSNHKDTIYENYKINYYPSGLLKSIASTDDTSRYINYTFKFKR